MAPEKKKRVKLSSLGTNRGQTVPISAGQLRQAGLDPDADLEANRYVFDNAEAEHGEIRLRIYPVKD